MENLPLFLSNQNKMNQNISYSLKYNYKVNSSDTDIEGRLKMGALLNFLIQSAINSSNELGFGFDEIKDESLFWVLSRVSIEINRPILWNEEITVETWPKNIEKILYLRDFIVRDKNENVIAKSTSGWLAINSETKRPHLSTHINPETYYTLKDKYALKEVPQKIMPIKTGEKFNVKTSFFDIDINRHVTSTRYLDWMIDTFKLNFMLKNYPTKISINYIKETKPSENIEIIREQVSKNKYIFEGKHLSNNIVSFRGIIEF